MPIPIKKIISALLIFTIFTFAQSNRAEANPALIIPFAAAAVGSVLLTAGVVKYYAPAVNSGLHNTVSNIGTLGRIAVATWNASTQYGTDQIYQKYVTAKISFSDLISKAVTPYMDPAITKPYPNLFTKLTMVNAPEFNETNNFQVGDIVKSGGVGFRITSTNPTETGYLNGGAGGYCAGGGFINSTSYRKCWGDLGNGFYNYCTWGSCSPSTLPMAAKSAKAISDSYNSDVASNLPLWPDVYSGEIDNLIKDQPNIVHYVDTTTPESDLDTAPPFVPPATAVAPGSNTTTAPTSSAATSAQTAAQTKAQVLSQATSAVENYQTAHPASTVANDPVLKDLVAAKDAAQVAATAASNLAAQTAAEADVSVPAANADALKAIDFTPFLTLQGVLANKFPFTLLSSISGYLNVLSGTGTAPVFHIPIYGNILTIDLSFMDSVAIVSRYLIATLMSVGCVFYVVRRYTD